MVNATTRDLLKATPTAQALRIQAILAMKANLHSATATAKQALMHARTTREEPMQSRQATGTPTRLIIEELKRYLRMAIREARTRAIMTTGTTACLFHTSIPLSNAMPLKILTLDRIRERKQARGTTRAGF